MNKLYSFFSSIEKSTLIICLIFSLAITRFIAFPLFEFLTSGKVLHGRNIWIQIGFQFALFLLILAVSFWLLHRPLRWLIRHPLVPFAIVSLFPLAAHAYMGSFSRFVADDFSSATLAVNKGILAATVDWYVNWSGRFSASFFDSVMGYLPPSAMMMETGLALFLILVGSALSVWQLVYSPSKIARISLAVMAPAIILTGGFALTPDLPQALYWGQGMRSLILPLIPASFMVAAFIYIANSKSTRPFPFLTGCIALSAFIAGGFGETYVVLQIAVTALAGVVVFFSPDRDLRSRLFPVLATAFVFSIAAMMVMILAPGNNARQAYFPAAPDPMALTAISFHSLGEFSGKLVADSGYLISVIILVIFVCIKCLCAIYDIHIVFPLRDHPFFSSGARIFFFVFISTFLLLFASFVPAAYGMSTAPPDRTLILPSLIVSGFLASLGFLAGRIFQNSSIRKSLNKPVSGWLLFASFSFSSWWITTSIIAPAADYRFFANRFDRADRMIREAKASGLTSVEVPEVHNHFGLSDYGAGTTYWLDDAVNSYYGIDVIVNKHKK